MKRIGFLASHDHTPKTLSPAAPLVPADFTHCAIVGRTGSGKTTGAILPNIAERIRLGHGVLVYDFKGNLHPKIKKLAYDHGRQKVVSLGHPWSPRINLVEGMTMNRLSDMLESTSGMDRKEDGFWISQAKDLVLPVIGLFRHVEKLAEILDLHGITCDFEAEYGNRRFRFDSTPSLMSVKKAISTLSEAARFFAAAVEFRKRLEAFYVRRRLYDIDSTVLHSRFKETLDHLESFTQLKERFPVSERDYKTNNSIHATALSMLEGLADNPAFNEREFDVAACLETGGIVVVDLRELTDAQVACFTQTLFSRFHDRFQGGDTAPVSVFIDEAQRVLAPGMDLPLDTMREARVDLFLAFQNAQVLQEKIGRDAYWALFGNLTTKILFAGDIPFDGVDTSGLGPFEYVSREDDYRSVRKAEPLFVTDKEAFEAEWRHQKANGVRKRYRIETAAPMRRKYICLYEPALYQEGLLTLQTAAGEKICAPYALRERESALRAFRKAMREKDLLDVGSSGAEEAEKRERNTTLHERLKAIVKEGRSGMASEDGASAA